MADVLLESCWQAGSAADSALSAVGSAAGRRAVLKANCGPADNEVTEVGNLLLACVQVVGDMQEFFFLSFSPGSRV